MQVSLNQVCCMTATTITPKLRKCIAVNSHALVIPSVEQARENLGHEAGMSNHLSQEVHGQTALWSGSFAPAEESAAAGCQP